MTTRISATRHQHSLVSIRLITDDVARLVDFYEKVSGTPVRWSTPDFAEVQTPGLTTTGRAFAVLTMLLGAAVGALLVLHSGLASALGVALFLLGLVVAVAASRSRRTARWQTYHLTS